MNKTNSREISFDIIKIIATFLVLFYHLEIIDMGYVQGEYYRASINYIITGVCAMSVPLFFMVHGALLLRKKYSIKVIMGRMIKLLTLLVIWSVIIFSSTQGILVSGYYVSFFKLIVSGSDYTTHLWFLRTMLILTLLLPILYKVYTYKYKILLQGIIIILLLCPFTYNLIILFANRFGWEYFSKYSITGVFTMYSVLYFLVGKIMYDSFKRNKVNGVLNKYVLPLLATITGWTFIIYESVTWTNLIGDLHDNVNSCFPTMGALLLAVGVFRLILNINISNKRLVNIIKTISDNILGVYLLHYPITILVEEYLDSEVPLMISLIIAILIFISIILVTMLIRKIPHVRKLMEI